MKMCYAPYSTSTSTSTFRTYEEHTDEKPGSFRITVLARYDTIVTFMCYVRYGRTVPHGGTVGEARLMQGTLMVVRDMNLQLRFGLSLPFIPRLNVVVVVPSLLWNLP